MSRNDTFPNKFQALLKDIGNLTGDIDWEVRTYLAPDRIFAFNDPELFNHLILVPEAYVTRDEFKMKDMKESIDNFFKESYMSSLTIDGNTVTLYGGSRGIVAEVVDIGDYDTVIGRNFLSESAFGVDQVPYEAKVLQSIIGDCQILPLGKYLCVNRGEQVVLLQNTELKYRNG
jgi:hypothetical protein